MSETQCFSRIGMSIARHEFSIYVKLGCITQSLPHLGAKLVLLGEWLTLLLKHCQRKRWYFTLYVKACCYRSCQEVGHSHFLSSLAIWDLCLFQTLFEYGIQIHFSCPDEVPKTPQLRSCDKDQAFPLTNKAVKERRWGSSFVLHSADSAFLYSMKLRSKGGSRGSNVRLEHAAARLDLVSDPVMCMYFPQKRSFRQAPGKLRVSNFLHEAGILSTVHFGSQNLLKFC